jgi:hypothetical protein
MAVYTAIDDPSAYFKVQLYTGNGSANHAITFDDTDTDMQPDLVWIKNRDATDAHCLFDSVRGATKLLSSDAITAESTDADTLDSFTSDGFQVDADVKVNTNTEKYVAWNWKETADAGFDIVAYTGNGTDGATVSHSLGAVPNLLITKGRSVGDGWVIFFKNPSGGNPHIMGLNNNLADRYGTRYDPFFSSTAPTSSVFTLGDDTEVNTDGGTFIAYLWTEKQGFSKFGSYTGNANADGPFVYTGFRPALVIIKGAVSGAGDAAQNWELYDNKRLGYNVDNNTLFPSTTAADNTADRIDILSNGFKIRVNSDGVNDSGSTYIYMAFAEAPFVTGSGGVPCNAR